MDYLSKSRKIKYFNRKREVSQIKIKKLIQLNPI